MSRVRDAMLDFLVARGDTGVTSFLLAVIISALSCLYLLESKPDLRRGGMPCNQQVLTERLDWMFWGLLLLSTLLLGVCLVDQPSKCMRASLACAIPLSFGLACAKAAALAFLYPEWCTLFELVWCLNFGLLMAAPKFEAYEETRPQPPRDRSQVEVEVAKTIAGLKRVASPAIGAGTAPESNGCPESGWCAERCVICLAE